MSNRAGMDGRNQPMTQRIIAAVALAALTAGLAQAQEADAHRGGELYRACVACHSLEPSVHLTGPSLSVALLCFFGRRSSRITFFTHNKAQAGDACLLLTRRFRTVETCHLPLRAVREAGVTFTGPSGPLDPLKRLGSGG
jgi:cytochrome c2